MQYVSEEKRSAITFCTPAGREESQAYFSFSVWKKIKQKLIDQQKSIVDLLYVELFFLHQWFGSEIAKRIVSLRMTARVEFFMQTMNNQNIVVIAQEDRLFPSCLKEKLKENCPEVLYGRGNLDLLLSSQKRISVTGTRKCTTASIQCAREVAQHSAHDDVCIVSGGAQGIDMTAHQAILEAGGSTIAVLPFGLNSSSVRLLEKSLYGCYLLLTPFGVLDGFTAGHALYRNHLIYALGHQTIVIESGDGYGGTWNGANHALKKHYCSVYVVDEPRLNGNMRLLALQAKKYEKWDDHFGKKET